MDSPRTQIRGFSPALSRRFVVALLFVPVLSMAACYGRAGEELQYNHGRLEFALPNVKEAESVESYAQRRIAAETRTLSSRLEQPDIVQAVKRANTKHAALPLGEILNLDDQWQNSPADSAFIAERVDSGCTEYTKRIVRVMPAMAEVFVTDRKGLVVCQSGKTTDYYQADEQWWIDTYAEGRGRTHHGPLEFDQSANTYAVSIYLPILDAGSLVGIAKAAMTESAMDPSRIP
jgi:hypothetical protein